jgi:hypothetical protein
MSNDKTRPMMRPLSEYLTYGAKGYECPDTGLCFGSLEDLLQTEILGHCGCGMPAENLELIFDMLKIHQDYRNNAVKVNDASFKKAWDEYQETIKNYITENWKKFDYFFSYVMNDKNIMEHGGSVPGWICDDNFVDALNVWHAEYIKDE